MDKKGDLLKNVLTLIIAAIGLGLIIIAGVKLYNLNKDQEFENARKLLDGLIGKVENVKDGETGKPVIRGVDGWVFAGWSGEDNNRPDKCFFNSCICVCKTGEDGPFFKGRIFNPKTDAFSNEIIKTACQSEGFCRKIEVKKVSVSAYRDLIIKYKNAGQNDQVETQKISRDYIPMQGNLLELLVKRSGDSLSVVYVGELIEVEEYNTPRGVR